MSQNSVIDARWEIILLKDELARVMYNVCWTKACHGSNEMLLILTTRSINVVKPL